MEVHAPDHPIHTWRDFFTHIATIVVGLLIAIGLEQTVEWMHHRHELREARDAMESERKANREAFRFNTKGLRYNIAQLRNNLTVLVYLQAHPGTPEEKLPGVLTWGNWYAPLSDMAWRSAQSANLPQLMPADEVFRYSGMYQFAQSMNVAGDASWDATSQASSYLFRDPNPTHLSAAALEREIDLTERALTAKYTLGVEMANFVKAFPDFAPGPTLEELSKLSIAPEDAIHEERMKAAGEMTRQRMAATPSPTF